jgi:hypothetical protein
LREICPRKKRTPKSGAASGTIAGVLLRYLTTGGLIIMVQIYMNTIVYRIFCDDGALHQGYICGFDTKEGYYKIKFRDGDIEEATEEEVD